MEDEEALSTYVKENMLGSMKDATLLGMLNAIHDELRVRALIRKRMPIEPGTVIFDEGSVTYCLNSGAYMQSDSLLRLDLIVINNSDHKIKVLYDETSVNGWNVNAFIPSDNVVTPGRKRNQFISFQITDANISRLDDVHEIEFNPFFYDEHTGSCVGRYMKPKVFYIPGNEYET